MKKIRPLNLVLAVAVAGAGVGLYFVLRPAGESAAQATFRTAEVTSGTVQATISAQGNVAAALSTQVRFETAGEVDSVSVRVGDQVTEGQQLATVDPNDADADTEAADDADDAEDDSTSLEMTAPFDGVITAVNVAVGDSIPAEASESSGGTGGVGGGAADADSGEENNAAARDASAYITVTSLETMEITAAFSEADSAGLDLGQAATCTFPALDGVSAAGQVTWISPEGTASGSLVTYSATVTLDTVPDGLRLGQTATVLVVTSEAADVLTLPVAAVTVLGNGQGQVKVTTDGGATTESVVIEIGVVGDSLIEVVSGLEAGQVVLISTDTATGASSNQQIGGGFGGGQMPGFSNQFGGGQMPNFRTGGGPAGGGN